MGGAILDAGEGAIDKLIGGDFFTVKNIALRGTLGAIPLMGKNIFAAFMRRGLDEALAGNFLRDFASEVDQDMTPKELKKLRSAIVDEFVNMLDLQKDKIKDNLDVLKVESDKLKKQMDAVQTQAEEAETQKKIRQNKKLKKIIRHLVKRLK